MITVVIGYITPKDEVLTVLKMYKEKICENWKMDYTKDVVISFVDPIEQTNDMSDGYHTFDELYYHRMILFSVICNQNKYKAWKSMLHHDGSMYEGYFIAGIATPEGNYTYHFEKKYWDKFDVPILSVAPEWDGHVASDIDRLYSLLG